MSITPTSEYRVGSLTYDKRSLRWLFFWLLLGNFSMAVTASALPRLLPLQLDVNGLKASDIGWLLSLGPLASLLLSPFIGVWSDRLRSKWGRRRPFLLISTPIMAAGLVVIPHIKSSGLLLAVIIIVQVANVIENVLYYLYADVVPAELMGRFMAAFRIVGTLGIVAFNSLLLPLFGTSPSLVWAICGISSLVLYQTSLHFVREGSYPPPVKEKAAEIVKDYIKDGMGSRYIWLFWLSLSTMAVATGASAFTDLFSKNQLHLDMAAIGKMNAWAAVPSLFLMYPAGWLVDRYGPGIVWGTACVVMGLVGAAGYFLVNGFAQMLWFTVAYACVYSFLVVALMPMLYAHLPKNKFGQLVSMQSVVVQSFIFLNTNAVGHLVSAMGNNYRIVLIYGAPFLILTPIFLWLMRHVPNPFAGQEMSMVTRKSAPVHP